MRLLRVLIVLLVMLMTVYWVTAQEDTSRDNEPNWCYEGEEWGDGRCNHPDPDINEYNWRVGWLFAQCDLGNLPLEACYPPNNNDDDSDTIEPSPIIIRYAFRSISSGSVSIGLDE